MRRNSKVSRSIPLPIRCLLWRRAAGRCEFSGCNTAVTFNSLTKEDINLAEVAHIIGFSEDGPRGENDISEELAKDISNLMLLCSDCHKTIDTNKGNYPVALLQEMKKAHETRIAMVSSITDDKQSHILLYGANVGEHNSPVSYKKAACSILPDWYPAESIPISLGMKNSSFNDRTASFWKIEETHLYAMVAQKVKPRLADGNIEHLSIFAFAPQPLLMLLGYLISDIPSAETYQLHREPADWKWQVHPDGFEYNLQEPPEIGGPPALVLSLSATINDDRILAVVEDATIWRLTIEKPHNDFLKSRQQLMQFRLIMRQILDLIKAQHGESAIIHVFPAIPVAAAVDFGRIIMPKADLPMRIYDANKTMGGFIHALDLHANIHQERGAL